MIKIKIEAKDAQDLKRQLRELLNVEVVTVKDESITTSKWEPTLASEEDTEKQEKQEKRKATRAPRERAKKAEKPTEEVEETKAEPVADAVKEVAEPAVVETKEETTTAAESPQETPAKTNVTIADLRELIVSKGSAKKPAVMALLKDKYDGKILPQIPESKYAALYADIEKI